MPPPPSDRPDRYQTVAHLASTQHGVFTRAQAIHAGFTPGGIDSRTRRGLWISVDHGVYRTADSATSWHQRLVAACLVGPAVASHRSAARLWGFDDAIGDLVEVTALRHRRRKADGVIWHESLRLVPQDITILEDVPVTGATRTILDLGVVLDESAVLAVLDDAIRRSLTTAQTVLAELERFGDRRRGSGVVRRAARRRIDGPTPESPIETLFDALVADHGLPGPVRQWLVRDNGGRVIARVDFAYPNERLVIEIDGARFHATGTAWQDDLSRQNSLVALGLRVLRFTARDLRRSPDRVAETVRSALQLGRASLTPP
ncbi:MAG TPA: type IV toxin-antitoxin system AbiEi family antitoxin domain-containing protein [Acidimicrobiia bacterium]|nr:type IV toxin-antitoxin system AbiEi family antitoxin domain-containing protein [Acidimicrobiia bacterium]